MTSVQKVIGIGVFRELACHGTNDAQVISACGNMREQFTDGKSARTVLGKLPGAPQRQTILVELRSLLGHRKWLPIEGLQLWLGIERVDLRHTAIHEQEDDVLSSGWMMQARRSTKHTRLCQHIGG
jgi:hypothetical protein